MQRARRRDPMPWTAEIALVAGILTLLSLLAGIQAGRTVANLVAGAGWTWPVDQAAFWRSLVPVTTQGDAAAGLPRPRPTDLADPPLVWGAILTTELLTFVGLVLAACYLYQRWGPGRVHGMANPGEAQRMLGLTRLRRVAPVVRPDLYGKTAAPRAPVAPAQESPSEEVALGRGLNPRFLPHRFDRGRR